MDSVFSTDKVMLAILRALEKNPADPSIYHDAMTIIADHIRKGDEGWIAANKAFRNRIVQALRASDDVNDMGRLKNDYKWSFLLNAQADFDDFCQYIEMNRDVRKRFYFPRRKQLLPIVQALQDLADDKLDLLAISMPPGTGKALANDTPILTRNGWKNHGDLVVGDEVIGMDGKFKKVIAVHPKCMLDRLVEFTNGEKIQCHENHEWMFNNRWKTTYKDRPCTEETKVIEKIRLEKGGDPGHRGHRYMLLLPDRGPVVGEQKVLPLDPYTFGVWLGDGANKNPRISLPRKDICIIHQIVNNGLPVRWSTEHKTTGVLYFDFNMRKELQKMGMCHSGRTVPKYIPQEYMTASFEQRLQLLAGLLDTDGTLTGSKYIYSTVEPSLRDTFLELIATFGWRASLHESQPKVSSSGVIGRRTVYIISFTPDIRIPCAVERKRNLDPHKKRSIAFKSITKVEPKEGNCITVEGDGMYLAGKTMVPTHNTTLAIFYLCWLAGKRPDMPKLVGSHSNAFVRGVYDECLRILDKNGEYLWHDVFPTVNVVNTNAKDCRIDLDKRKRFETLEFTSVGSANAGLYRASDLLYCDDLVSGIEEALSRDRLDKLWEAYTVDLRQRKIGDKCKELHIATRWSVHDVIGRLERQFENDDRAKFIIVPALNDQDESNFDYLYGVGFSTEFYQQQKEIMDEISFNALYMQKPIEREGILYHPSELRRFFKLPDAEPDGIISICDTKDKGKDYEFLPVAYLFGEDIYIVDCICDNGKPEVVEERVALKLVEHHVQMARFESNSAGGHIAVDVDKRVKSLGGHTHITTRYTSENKETKIITHSAEVKRRCLFLDDTQYKPNSDYGRMVNMLTTYTMTGKNAHDDVPDGMAMLIMFVESMTTGKAEIIQRPW